MESYSVKNFEKYKYLFYTGKGGVGKTSTAAATAVGLAENGRKVLLVSTDPASNLQDIFNLDPTKTINSLADVEGLDIMNLDPLKSAAAYKEAVVAPYRGLLPESAIKNMEEQLSGSCTVEVAAFNEFTNLLSNEEIRSKYDNIIFDTAPTGHTLRMIELPSAWTSFLDSNTTGASCLGQLSGLGENREIYKNSIDVLSDETLTKIILVTKADKSPIQEVARAKAEMSELNIGNMSLVINGIAMEESDDLLFSEMKKKQEEALNNLPDSLKKMETYFIPLRAYNINSLDNIRVMLNSKNGSLVKEELLDDNFKTLNELAEDLIKDKTKVLFTMGKGGVGKTTVASALALYLSKKGLKVHLTTTDPASHLAQTLSENSNLRITAIDEKEELKAYKEEVLSKVVNATNEDIAYIEEDLRSPCTQEIAVFRKFAKIVKGSDEDIVIIDTAPTGHTLLLLDTTESYHKEVQRNQGDIPEEVKELLPRLRNAKETKVLIIALPEPTPFYEAKRLKEDLDRAHIRVSDWVLNQSFLLNHPTDEFLRLKAEGEKKWINEVEKLTAGNFSIIPWMKDELKEENLMRLFE
ncbi:MAG: arsenical pump-driving ATPase [Clostridiaceae bacterium]